MDGGPSVGHEASPDDRPVVLTLCTGNAARSVMAGVMLEAARAPVRVITKPVIAAVNGMCVGGGFEIALAADLIIAMASEHVRYVRRRHPTAADRTATLPWLASQLPSGAAPLATRVAALRLAEVDPDDQGDVDDPAGGDEAAYTACAVRLSALVAELVPRLG